MNGVTIKQITKTYEKGKVLALNGISFDVQPGELFGLIGPDGAGKTTLFRILTTLLKADEGAATVCGLDVVDQLWDIRKIVGYMPGRFSLYQDLSVEENLNFFASVFKTTVAKNYHLIKDIYVQLEPFRNRPAGKLSGGMKQKLALCCALVHEPQVLFLDEPTTGVDAVSRREFWDMLRNLKEQGITIVVSTPYMDEAERCDRIALLQEGQLMEVDTLEAIIQKYDRPLLAVRARDRYRLLQDLRNFPETVSCFAFGADFHVALESGKEAEGKLKEYLDDRDHRLLRLEWIQPTIEDTFIFLMEKQHDNADSQSN